MDGVYGSNKESSEEDIKSRLEKLEAMMEKMNSK